MLYNGKAIFMQVKVTRGQVALEINLCIPLPFIFSELKSGRCLRSQPYSACKTQGYSYQTILNQKACFQSVIIGRCNDKE
jgi:hypothetical protein